MTGFPDPNDPAYMDTPDVDAHPLEDYWTPERLAQRDRLAALLMEETPPNKHGQLCPIWVRRARKPEPTWRDCDCWVRKNAETTAARLIAADVRVDDGELRREERDHLRTIAERDHAQDMADQLAYALGGPDIGEHSNMNDPWQNALDNAPVRVGPDEGLRAATQSLVDALDYVPGSALGGKIALVIAALAEGSAE